jgi:hypothetical protein
MRVERASPGSVALARGSLAAGASDIYSDIDLLWDVRDDAFPAAVAGLRPVLDAVAAVASVRSDPSWQNSAKRRLLFVRFRDAPLFWRLDLDVFARSIGRDPAYDADNPAAKGSDWSRTESALANAVAALDAHARGRSDDAEGLLVRAFVRVGVPDLGGPLGARVLALSGAILDCDPQQADFARRIDALAQGTLVDG